MCSSRGIDLIEGKGITTVWNTGMPIWETVNLKAT